VEGRRVISIICGLALQTFERETNRVKAADKAIKDNKVLDTIRTSGLLLATLTGCVDTAYS
jgi:hypothetical protein